MPASAQFLEPAVRKSPGGEYIFTCPLCKKEIGGLTLANTEMIVGSHMETDHPNHLKLEKVDHPPHYNDGAIECIDALASALGPDGFAAFCVGNAVKYLWRYRHKGSPTEDLKKARWYLDRAIDPTGKTR